MKDQIISFETAKLAKEKGFWIEKSNVFILDKFKGTSSYGVHEGQTYEQIKDIYFKRYDIFLFPTQSLLQKWLREKHNIQITIHYHKTRTFNYGVENEVENLIIETFSTFFNTYELALEHALYHTLETL